MTKSGSQPSAISAVWATLFSPIAANQIGMRGRTGCSRSMRGRPEPLSPRRQVPQTARRVEPRVLRQPDRIQPRLLEPGDLVDHVVEPLRVADGRGELHAPGYTAEEAPNLTPGVVPGHDLFAQLP